MLEKVVGSGHVAVAVTAQMDYGRVEPSEGGRDRQSGSVKRLHVAVLVDHDRIPGTHGEPDTLVPRGEEQLGHIAAIAAQAAGVDEERGDRLEVRSVPFAQEPAAPAGVGEPPAQISARWPLPRHVLIPAAVGAGALLVIGIALSLLLRAEGGRGRSALGAGVLPLPAAIHEVDRPLGRGRCDVPAGRGLAAPGSDVHQRVLDAVRADTARAARVLAALLAESKPGKV
jgi:flagellar biosynthesis/type III secretory pathway M-ring protein FliF/YscJ